MGIRLLLSALLLVCVGCTPVALGGTGAEAPRTRASTSLELIAEARERGEIDDDTAVLYGVLAVKDSSKLPFRYRGDRPIRDGTLTIREAKRRYPTLRPDIREALKPYLFPEG